MSNEEEYPKTPILKQSSISELYEESDSNNRNLRMKLIAQQSSSARPGMRKMEMNQARKSLVPLQLDFGVDEEDEEIPTERVRGSHQLKFVVLNGKSIDSQCEDLNLCFASLFEVPEILSHLNLRHLNLSFNRISSIQRPLSKCMDELMFLELSNNKLTSFPLQIQNQLLKLTSLNLAYNQLTEFPVAEGRIPFLISLNILSNCITDIPAHIIQTKLQKLIIEWKVFHQTPESLDFLGNLDYLGNTFLSFSAVELKELINDRQSLTVKDYLLPKFREENNEHYWNIVHNALRLKSFGVLHSLIDERPLIVLEIPKVPKPSSLLLWAISEESEIFIDYLAQNHSRIFERAIKNDPTGNLLQFLIRNK